MSGLERDTIGGALQYKIKAMSMHWRRGYNDTG